MPALFTQLPMKLTARGATGTRIISILYAVECPIDTNSYPCQTTDTDKNDYDLLEVHLLFYSFL
ncbi:MAG TPA: hypothetical protein DCZ73_09215 [Bacteroides sp.]|nr:hypothetical protein [Bacteroides sp.]